MSFLLLLAVSRNAEQELIATIHQLLTANH